MKGIIAIIIVIIILVVGFLMLRDGANIDTMEDLNTITNEVPAPGSEGLVDEMVVNDSLDTTGEIIVVTYTDEGFTPKEINVSLGQTVRFVNESSGNMWVGSAQHPSHKVYSDTSLKDHCPDTDGIAFDQCESGDEYEFTFAKIGEWGYHNHVKPGDFGKINVK